METILKILKLIGNTTAQLVILLAEMLKRRK